jgi:gas vesicle protein
MKRVIISILTGALLTGTATMAFAQDPPKEGKIKERKENQQKRIAQGVKSGSLTPKETAHIENNEAKLNKEVRQDRKANGGNLTNKEKTQVNNQQNKLSKQIYNQKHDGQTQ